MPTDQNNDRPTQFRKVVFVLACGTSWMLYLHRYVFGLIKPELRTARQCLFDFLRGLSGADGAFD